MLNISNIEETIQLTKLHKCILSNFSYWFPYIPDYFTFSTQIASKISGKFTCEFPVKIFMIVYFWRYIIWF